MDGENKGKNEIRKQDIKTKIWLKKEVSERERRMVKRKWPCIENTRLENREGEENTEDCKQEDERQNRGLSLERTKDKYRRQCMERDDR